MTPWTALSLRVLLSTLWLTIAFACIDPALARHKQYAAVTPDISCPGDRIVWVNIATGIYHLEGERWFGRTNDGKFVCEKAAKTEGDRATRNGQ